ncbi:aromatic-ring-hydroxylating dioxygenase subunit beta [soil metagenome]
MSSLLDTPAAQTVTDAAITLDEAMAFVWAEAETLDRLAYKDWLKLWTDTGLYIIPIEREGDPREALNIVYDNQDMRQARAKRLMSGFSMSSAPPARTIRTLSRFVVAEQGPGAITLRCAQILVEYKYTRTRTLAADVTYRLVRTADGIRIETKSILLINSDDGLFGIGYLL